MRGRRGLNLRPSNALEQPTGSACVVSLLWRASYESAPTHKQRPRGRRRCVVGPSRARFGRCAAVRTLTRTVAMAMTAPRRAAAAVAAGASW